MGIGNWGYVAAPVAGIGLGALIGVATAGSREPGLTRSEQAGTAALVLTTGAAGAGLGAVLGRSIDEGRVAMGSFADNVLHAYATRNGLGVARPHTIAGAVAGAALVGGGVLAGVLAANYLGAK